MTDLVWPVVPLSDGQLRDVTPADILEDGLYRKCDTYKGGGGYDKFPDVCEDRIGERLHNQFVVQLKGCNLDCPYCYVTREGVWGKPVHTSNERLVEAFKRSGQEVFHLMGGAPAMRLPQWGGLINELFRECPDAVFHSDLMLTERPYRVCDVASILHPRALYAVSIKGLTSEEHLRNTRKPINWEMFWDNWRLLQDLRVPFYLTYTGVDPDALAHFESKAADRGITLPDHSLTINLIDYEATKYVDRVAWGGHHV